MSLIRAALWTTRPWPLFGVALLLHVALVFVLGHYRHPTLWENGAIADHLAAGKGFSIDFSIPGEPTSWQSPGYPYLLSELWHLFGKGPTAHLFLSLCQAAVAASMVFPIGWLAERWFGVRAGTIGRWLACLMPLYFWYPTRIHQTAFVMALHPWLLYAWLTLRERPSVGRAAATGIGTGAAGLFQPIFLLTFGLLSLGLLAASIRRREMLRTTCIVFAGCLTLLVITPWTIRNYEVHHRFVLIKDSFGKEFWMGNNPHATGTAFIEGGGEEITNAYPPKAFALLGTASEIQLMDAMGREGLDYCRADPGAFVKRTAKKIAWYWTLAPKRFERSAIDGEALTFRWILASYWFAILAFAFAAFVFARPWPKEYTAILLLYVVVYSSIYGLIHVGLARYRGEIEFIFLPAVAAGLLLAWNKCRRPPPH